MLLCLAFNPRNWKTAQAAQRLHYCAQEPRRSIVQVALAGVAAAALLTAQVPASYAAGVVTTPSSAVRRWSADVPASGAVQHCGVPFPAVALPT